MMIAMKKMKNSIKTMVLTGAVVTLMMSLATSTAMAQEQEVQEMDHPDGSSNGNSSSTIAEEPLKDPGIELSDITPTDGQEQQEEGRLKDPGIELDDIIPTDGQEQQEEDTADGDSGSHDPGSSVGGEEDRIKDPGIRLCDIMPTDCQNPDDPQNDNKNNEHNNQAKYLEYCNSPSFVYDPACGNNNEHNDKDSDDSQDDDQGSNSGARSDAKDTNPGEEESKEEKASAPGTVKAGEVPMGVTKSAPESAASDPKEALNASDEAGQIANSEANSSPTVSGCPFDYEYIEEFYNTCIPVNWGFDVFTGDKPWPDTFGGYPALLGNLAADPLIGIGASVHLMSHVLGEALVDFGENAGPIGYGIQGLGHTLTFAGDAVGLVFEGAGELVGAVSDGAGAVVDTVVDNVVTPVLGAVVEGVEAVVESVEKVADVAKSTWKKISSWF